jgi:hypothetical protein
MAAAFFPIYTLVQSNQKVAYLGEYQVLARRRAYRALGYLEGRSFRSLQDASQSGAAPPAGIPLLPPEGRRVAFELGDGKRDVKLSRIPGNMGDGYLRRVKSVRTDVYFHQMEPGLGRLAALIRWRDPTTKRDKSFVAVRFVQAPFHFWVAR